MLLGPDGDAPAPFENHVDLVLVVVAVDLLALSRLEAVEIQLCARRGGERNLRHLVGLELRVLCQTQLHDASHRTARATSVTGWITSTSTPRRRQPLAICIRQPGFPVTTVRAPVSMMRSIFCDSSRSAISGCRMLYTPALPQHSSLSPSGTTVRPGIFASSARGAARTF